MIEKSCGTVLFTLQNNIVYYLLIKNEDSIWGFVKGNMQTDESETQAALRVTETQTSIKTKILNGFRGETSYLKQNGNKKTVAYFLADFDSQKPEDSKGYEELEYLLLPFEQALDKLTFTDTKEVLTEAEKFLVNVLSK